jgi:drug/metabolite transporter (DMT)-like permease
MNPNSSDTGSAWMLLAGGSFALMGVFVKLGGSWFSSHEMVFYRSVIALLLLMLFFVPYRSVLRGNLNAQTHTHTHAGNILGGHTRLHVRRSLIGFIALACFFYALAHLPLSVAITLNYASPLFLALLMPWQLGERPSRRQYATVAAGFCGVLLLLRPWQSPAEDLIAGAIGLFSGVMAAFAYINVRKLGRLHEPEWRTVFWFALVCALGAGVLTSIDGGWHRVTNPHQAGILLTMGIFATLGQLAMTRAYRTGKTVLVASFAYSTVVFASLLDVMLFAVDMPILAWIGLAITVLAGIQAARLNNR